MNRVRIHISGADVVAIAMTLLVAGHTGNPWWLLLIAVDVATWFFSLRWSDKTGWRFLHDKD